MEASGIFSFVPVWFLWLVAGIAVYWYLTKSHNYWKDLGIPSVPALPIVGSIGKAFMSPFHVMELERYRTKGRIYGAYEGSRPTLTVGDLEVLRDIFVKDFHIFTGPRKLSAGDPFLEKMVVNLRGEDWKRVRTLITPAFTTGKLKKMTSIFIECAKTLSTNFRKAATEDKPLDVKRFLGAFAMDVIASSAFATKIDSHSDPANPFVTAARGIFSKDISWRFILIALCPGIVSFFRISPFPPNSMQFFREVSLKIIKERKQSGQCELEKRIRASPQPRNLQEMRDLLLQSWYQISRDTYHLVASMPRRMRALLEARGVPTSYSRRNDLLQMLMDAEEEVQKDGIPKESDEVSEMGHEENNYQVLKPMRVLKSLSNDELVAQCPLFFLAGYDTTASTLAYTVYELALNPDIQERVIAEIDEAVREKGELRYESIFEMKYLDCVVSETLRKYPPSIRAERVAGDDYEIKKHSIAVPKGMIVGIPIYAIHHDPEYYPEPEKYDPERFAPEVKATRHPYAYLPFGAGPRNCIAMRFALTEIKVCLAYILSQFRFHTCSETSVPLKYFVGQVLMTPKEVMLKIEIRNDVPKK